MYALLGRFVGIDDFFSINTKFCDLDLDFALQWTHTDIDFSLFSFTPLITCMPYLVGLKALMSSSQPTQNFVTLTLTSCFSEHTLILTLACFFFLLQPEFLTLIMLIVNISSFKVTYMFLALVFSVYVATLQSGHIAFNGFLFIFRFTKKCMKNLRIQRTLKSIQS